MDLLGKIRWHYRDGISIREIAAKTSLSRNTVRKYLRERQSNFDYPSAGPRAPSSIPSLNSPMPGWLRTNGWPGSNGAAPSSCTPLKALGYAGSYGHVVAYVRDQGRQGGEPSSAVFIPYR
jgi:hypothetical protein